MRRHRRRLHPMALILLVACSLAAYAQDTRAVAVIANKDNTVSNLSLAELRRILLGDRRYWTGSHKIVVLMPRAGSPERATVLQLLHMDERDYRKQWLAKTFAGDADGAPASMPASGTALTLVAESAEAMALIPASDVRGSVKIIKIDGHAPGDSTYPVH